MTVKILVSVTLSVALYALPCAAAVYDLNVQTSAGPDCRSMERFIHSATSRWPTPAEKCWALFYWLHQARRQTTPMVLHGMELTDPIRQFNDYGYIPHPPQCGLALVGRPEGRSARHGAGPDLT